MQPSQYSPEQIEAVTFTPSRFGARYRLEATDDAIDDVKRELERRLRGEPLNPGGVVAAIRSGQFGLPRCGGLTQGYNADEVDAFFAAIAEDFNR